MFQSTFHLALSNRTGGARKVAVALAAFAALSVAQLASAAPVFTLGNHPQADEQNILFGSQQTGTAVTGFTNQSHTQVLFTSSQSLTTGGIGQAFLQPTDDSLMTDFTFSVPSGTFRDFIFDPHFGSGTANVTVTSSEGSNDFSYTLGNGSNFLTIVAGDVGETLSLVSVLAPDGFILLEQPRVSGVSGGVSVPVPGTLALLGLGLGLTSLALRRKRA